MGFLDNLEAYLDKDPLGKSWKDAPDWCDDCNANPGEKCPDCGYTHNCQRSTDKDKLAPNYYIPLPFIPSLIAI